MSESLPRRVSTRERGAGHYLLRPTANEVGTGVGAAVLTGCTKRLGLRIAGQRYGPDLCWVYERQLSAKANGPILEIYAIEEASDAPIVLEYYAVKEWWRDSGRRSARSLRRSGLVVFDKTAEQAILAEPMAEILDWVKLHPAFASGDG